MSSASFPSQTPMDTAPRKSRVGRIILFTVLGLVVALLLLGGIAYALAGRFFSAQRNTPALLPADTQVYASINPSLSSLPGLVRLQNAYQQDNAEATADAEKQFEDMFGINFRQDVQPWIGPEMAIAVSGLTEFDAEAEADEMFKTADLSILLASRDNAKAEATLAKIRAKRQADEGETFSEETYKGVTITSASGADGAGPGAYAIVKDNAVIASRPETIKQMIDRDGATENTLAQSESYKQTIAGLPSDAIGYLYLSGELLRTVAEPSLQEQIDQLGDSTGLQEQFQRQQQMLNAFVGMGASISVPNDGVQFDTSVKIDLAQLDQTVRDQMNATKLPISDALLKSVSKDAIGAYAVPIPDTFRQQMTDLIMSLPEAEEQIAALEQQFDLDLEQDVLGWISGEFALVLLPGGEPTDESFMASAPVSGYLVVRSKDMASAKAGLPKIASALEQVGGITFESKQLGGVDWQTVGYPETEQAIGGYGFVGDSVVLGFLESSMTSAAGASSASLADDATFKTAQGHVVSPSGGVMYVNVQGAIDAGARAQGQSRAEFDETQQGRALKPVQNLIASGEPGVNDEGLMKARLFVTVSGE